MYRVSIIISANGDRDALRGTLWRIAVQPPAASFEVVVSSKSDYAWEELRLFAACFDWKFAKVAEDNPALKYNAAVRQSEGATLLLLPDRMIVDVAAFDLLLAADGLAQGASYELRLQSKFQVDSVGSNLTDRLLKHCRQWPLGPKAVYSDFAHRLTAIPRLTWDNVGGFNEEFLPGIGSEYADFHRRLQSVPGYSETFVPKAAGFVLGEAPPLDEDDFDTAIAYNSFPAATVRYAASTARFPEPQAEPGEALEVRTNTGRNHS